TNAGKSTLFNRLTGAGVLADAKMFATLDTTVRQVALPSRRRALLSDTVGFISNLPTTLVKAFRATLEEVSEASLLLHLVDASSPTAAEQTAHVFRVLGEIGAATTPQILVLTKMDRMSGESTDPAVLARRLMADAELDPAASAQAVCVSALSGEGLEALLARVDQMLPLDPVTQATFLFPHDASAELHLLHEFGRVLESRWEEEGCHVLAEVPASVLRRLRPFATSTL
ncbi:MAG: 50S ribosome-binding GTPase, partial [Acidobacteriia bacterium]|nr:50S ribosome-binding GTPase [Terriglobia bacterium]